MGSGFPLKTFFAALLAATILACSTPAVAFDTGAHSSLTVDALRQSGFSADAIDTTQIANWLTDYYTSRPFVGADQCDLEKLHFDDVFSTVDVAQYWATFTTNTKSLVTSAVHENDVEKFLVVLGMSLHVVQDFYAHSNWVESRQQGIPPFAHRSGTWFSVAPRPATIFTGWYDNCLHFPQGSHPAHGGYAGFPPQAMNHDSYVRPNYTYAYVSAYAATHEWTENLLAWARAINPAFVARVRGYQANPTERERLVRDREAALYISEWAEKPTDHAHVDGHWQGNPSGIFSAFLAYAAAWAAKPDSEVVAKFKSGRYYTTLSRGLYAGDRSPQPPITTIPMQPERVVLFYTYSIEANSSFTGTDSYYGELLVNGVTVPRVYRDAIEYHRAKTQVRRVAIAFVPRNAGPVSFRYQLWNEFRAGSNRAEPVHGNATVANFSCTMLGLLTCTGDLNGQGNDQTHPMITQGNGINGVKVRLVYHSEVPIP
jgi:hypothetical protein